MRRILPILMLFLLFAAAAHAQSASRVRSRAALQTAYVNLDNSAAQKDVNGVLAFLTDDWRGYGEDGAVITKKQLAQQMRLSLRGSSGMVVRTTLQSVRFSGRTATVRTRTVVEELRVRPASPIQPRVAHRANGSALWVQTGGGWKMKRVRGHSFLLAVTARAR